MKKACIYIYQATLICVTNTICTTAQSNILIIYFFYLKNKNSKKNNLLHLNLFEPLNVNHVVDYPNATLETKVQACFEFASSTRLVHFQNLPIWLL